MSNMIGRIYRIISTVDDTISYIGSTFNTTRDRFYLHKKTYNQWLNNNSREVSIYPFFKKLGIDNFKCILIKEYNVADKYALLAWEQLWINKFRKTAVNKINPFQPLPKQQHRISCKTYDDANKAKTLIRSKAYRIANAEQRKEKHICVCGGTYKYRHKSTHLNTKKHQKYLAQNVS